MLISTDGIDPVLDEVEVVTTPATRRADDTVDAAEQAQTDAAAQFASADSQRIEVARKAVSAGTDVVEAQIVQREADAEVGRQRKVLAARQAVTDRRRRQFRGDQAVLREVAVAMFSSKPRDEMSAVGTYEQLSKGGRRDAVRASVADDQSAIVDASERSWRTARGASRAQQRRVDRSVATAEARAKDVAEAIRLRDDLQAVQRGLEAGADKARRRLDAAGEDLQGALVDRRRARLTARVEGVDLTLVDLHAYWRAAAVAPCTIPWWVLAGVGKVETRHGTAQGSTVGADGTTSKRILGIPLDGRPGVAAIGDSDGGALDGSAAYDRAVGPMQFIPSTWRRWATDANGDGKQDPHNLYDAAGAAANYLCFGRGTLLTDAAQRGALLSYNHSVPYGTKVLGEAHGYQSALDLPDVPPEEAGRSVQELAADGDG
ncbi:hypothetical protein BH10ACT1_BH10ACT1_36290 [soil metagenome]